ncbi:MAG: hypothetical protein QOK11_1032, partial [Pseudonocardiales bacterium]|nr:hypothetical protein [Pseudonocardiales bacterium]
RGHIAMRLPEAGDAHDLLGSFTRSSSNGSARLLPGGLERSADVAREIWVRHRAQ